MNTKRFLDLDKVFLEVTLEHGRYKVFALTSAIFVWDGWAGCYFGTATKTVELFIPIKDRRQLKNGNTRLADIFSAIAYLLGTRNGFIVLMEPAEEKSITTQSGNKYDCEEYQLILSSSIRNISVLVGQGDK